MNMDDTKHMKPTVKKNVFGGNPLDKTVKRGKSKKKKSSRKKQDKDNDKCSTSPEIEQSDQELNDFDAHYSRTEAVTSRQDDGMESYNTVTTTTQGLSRKQHNSSHASKKRDQSQPPPSIFQLQPQAIGYGENLTIVPRKVVSSTSYVLPTSKQKMYGNSNMKSTENDFKLKKLPSQSSVLSSKSSNPSLTSIPESRSQGSLRADINNESLRWDHECSNSEDEDERIKHYKLNRRKRYLAAANRKYSDWLKTLHELEHMSEGNSTRQNRELKRRNSTSAFKLSPRVEGLVSGLAPPINLHNNNVQVMLNC